MVGLAFAGQTLPPAVFSWSPVVMATNALGLTSVESAQALATHHIHFVRDRLEMRRVHAHSVAAQVIEDQTSRDRSTQLFERAAVSHRGGSGLRGDPSSVTVPVARTRPRPALIGSTPVNLRPEALRERLGVRLSAGDLCTRVAALAPGGPSAGRARNLPRSAHSNLSASSLSARTDVPGTAWRSTGERSGDGWRCLRSSRSAKR